MLKSYVIGFILSLIVTLSSFTLVIIHVSSQHETIPHTVLIATIIVFAIIQLIVQLIFFLHMGREKGSQWRLAFFISTIGVVLILVIGSLWIMSHLNYNMSPDSMTHVLIHDEGFSPKQK